MPSYKWTGSNEQGFVSMGGKKFEKDVPVEVNDPALGAKLDGNTEFEQVSGASADLSPVWNPPGPTGIGTGPGAGPYQTTHEVVDMNPVEGAGQPTPEELEEERKATEKRNAEGEELPPEEPLEVTEEGPRKKSRKSSAPPESA
jgi:hypothetical protein